VDDLLEVQYYTLKILIFYGRRDKNTMNPTEGSWPSDDLKPELSRRYDKCPAYYMQMAEIEQKNESPVTTLKSASDGQTWCTGHKYGSVKLWTLRFDESTQKGILEQKQCISAVSQLITSIAFSSNNDGMAFSTEDGEVYVLKRQKIRKFLDSSWKGTPLGASGKTMEAKRLAVRKWLKDCDLIIEDLGNSYLDQEDVKFVACKRLDFLKFDQDDVEVLEYIKIKVDYS
jgi:WD40 repeat protein